MAGAGGSRRMRVRRGSAVALLAVVALAGCSTPEPEAGPSVPAGAGLGAAGLSAPPEPQTAPVREGTTYEPCERTPADLTTTNLRPNALTEADRALAGDLADRIPDGELVVEPATELTLEDGRLAFTDGVLGAIAQPEAGFQEVATGTVVAPVTIQVLDSPTEGRRVAFVEVRLSSDVPVRWEEAPELGFGTDAGMGSVVAGQAAQLSFDDPESTAYFDAFYPGGQYTGNVCVLRLTDGVADVVLFSSGWGDGGYPTYAGYDADGEMVSLVSHGFIVPWVLSGLPGRAPEIEGEPPPA